MKISVRSCKFPYPRQDLFKVWEGSSPNHGSGSMGLFSRFMHQKADRLGKKHRNVEAGQDPKEGHVSCMLDRSQLMEALTRIIDELPAQEKILFSLYYCEKLNFKEIGEVLGYSEPHVIRLLSDGMKKVAEKMQRKEDS
jgi:RNA polymerase sigma factor (sigma-70 family)